MTILLWLLSLLQIGASQELQVTFIGNAAFQLSDGTHTLVSDFPYVSGAFGYMTYEMDSVLPEGEVLSMITHHHRDHFAPELLDDEWTLVAGPGIEDQDHPRRMAWSDTLAWGKFTIVPIKTPHTPQHHSYIVHWENRSFYFTGDTESTAAFPADTVDVFFITPWLMDSAQKQGVPVRGKDIVIHHHKSGQRVRCDNCIVPAQGDVIGLP